MLSLTALVIISYIFSIARHQRLCLGSPATVITAYLLMLLVRWLIAKSHDQYLNIHLRPDDALSKLRASSYTIAPVSNSRRLCCALSHVRSAFQVCTLGTATSSSVGFWHIMVVFMTIDSRGLLAGDYGDGSDLLIAGDTP